MLICWFSPKELVGTRILNQANEAEHRFENKEMPWLLMGTRGYLGKSIFALSQLFFFLVRSDVADVGETQKLEWFGLQECLLWEPPGAWRGVGAWLVQNALHAVPNPEVAPGNPGILWAGTDQPGPVLQARVLRQEGQEHSVDGSWLSHARSLH